MSLGRRDVVEAAGTRTVEAVCRLEPVTLDAGDRVEEYERVDTG